MERIVEKYWEFAVFADNDFFCNFKAIKNCIKNNKSVKSIFCADDLGLFLFAVEDEHKTLLENQLKKQVIDYILKIEKPKFLKKNLKNLYMLGNLDDIFLKILCMFDTESDIIEIEKNLRLDEQIYLKEFFCFKLKNLQRKWKQVCDLTNENDFFFSSSELVFQLIRFLLKDSKRKCKTVSITNENSCVKILKNDNELIKQIEYKIWTKDVENEIVLEILENMPEKILISNKKQFDPDFLGLLDLIFKNNLKFVFNA